MSELAKGSIVELTARVRHEDDSYWAEVIELPGCFATGDTLDELTEALLESIRLYQQDDKAPKAPGGLEVAEMKLATTTHLERA